MENVTVEVASSVGSELYGAVADFRRTVRRAVRSQFPAHPLTPSQAEVLGRVRRRPGVGVGEVAAALRLAPNTVSTIVGKLVEADLVRRDPDPDDARAICLRLTLAGHRRVQAWRDRTARTVDGALAQLSDDDRAAIARAVPALGHLADAVAAIGEDTR